PGPAGADPPQPGRRRRARAAHPHRHLAGGPRGAARRRGRTHPRRARLPPRRGAAAGAHGRRPADAGPRRRRPAQPGPPPGRPGPPGGAADSLARRFEAAGITLDRDLAASPVLADPHWLHQVITNLLTNALKFTPSGGHVTISTERTGSHAILRVTDTGAGIA